MRKIAAIITLLTILGMIAPRAYADQQNIRIGLMFEENAPQNIVLKSEEGICIGTIKQRGNFKTLKEVNASVLKVFKEDSGRIRIETTQDTQLISLTTSRNNMIAFKPVNGIIYIGGKPYRGKALIYASEHGLTVINELGLEEYLYGVVPVEVSHTWPIEALKAQAVAARTYALKNFNRYKHLGFNLSNTVDCQVYGGYEVERQKTNKAVDETKGVVITYNDKLINAFYHADNGGYTESSDNVWGFSLPYLNPKPDVFSKGSPHGNWEISFSNKKIQRLLEQKKIKIGTVIGIKILETSESGRVIKMAIYGSMGQISLEKQQIRDVLGLKSTMFQINTENSFYIVSGNRRIPQQSSLDSMNIITSRGRTQCKNNSYFYIKGMHGFNKAFNKPKTYVIKGKGWGHGVGLSQWGAKTMADKGYKYKEILKHYYQGSEVNKIRTDVPWI